MSFLGGVRLLLAAGWLASACSASPPPLPQNPAPVAIGGAPVAALPQDGDTSKDPAPEEHVATLRLRNIEALVRENLPADRQNATGLLVMNRLRLQEALMPGLELSAPIDIGFCADRQTMSKRQGLDDAVSVGVRSPAQLRESFGTEMVEKLSDGAEVYSFGEPQNRTECILAPSLGATSARMVCSSNIAVAKRLYRYMTRSLAAQAIDKHDAEFTLNVAKLASLLRDRDGFFESELSELGLPDALTKILNTERSLVVKDLDTLHAFADYDWDAKSLSVELRLKLRSRQSWLLDHVLRLGAQASAPADVLLDLPNSSGAVVYRGASIPKDQEKQPALTSTFEALTAQFSLPAADRAKLEHLVYEPFRTSCEIAIGWGNLELSTDAPPRAAAVSSQQRDFNAALGWTVIGLQEPPARTHKWMQDLARASRNTSFQKVLQAALGGGNSVPRAHLSSTTVPGAGAATELTILIPISSPDMEPKRQTLRAYLLMLPEKDRTWLALGGDRTTLLTKLSDCKQGKNALRSTAAGGQLQTTRPLAAGLLSLAGLGNILVGRHGQDALRRLNQNLSPLPHGGNTPAVLTVQANPEQATIELHVSFPHGLLDDLRKPVTESILVELDTKSALSP